MDGMKGMIPVGIDYYTDIVREHAIMQEQIKQLRKFLKEDKFSTSYVSAKEVARIFGFNLDDPSSYQE